MSATRPPRCTLSGTVAKGKIELRLDQAPGALLAVFGDRSDGDAAIGETKEAGPYARCMIESFAAIASGGMGKDATGAFSANGVNAMMQAMSAFEPANEVEGMIAAQAVAMHFVTMDSLARAQRAERGDFRQQHLSAANKSARTYAALLDALNRHRGKITTQRVVVENVTVEAGGQAVVGAVTGAGAKQIGETQTHGQGSRRSALSGPQPEGLALPAPSVERAEALPHARRRGRERRA